MWIASSSRSTRNSRASTSSTEALVAKAQTICPYSKATRGNIDIKLLANEKPVEGGQK